MKEEAEVGQQLKGFPAKNNHLEKCFPVQPQRAQRLQQLQQEEEAKAANRTQQHCPRGSEETVEAYTQGQKASIPGLSLSAPRLGTMGPAASTSATAPAATSSLLWHTTSSKLIPGR